jgi:hypothetical protein
MEMEIKKEDPSRSQVRRTDFFRVGSDNGRSNDRQDSEKGKMNEKGTGPSFEQSRRRHDIGQNSPQRCHKRETRPGGRL